MASLTHPTINDAILAYNAACYTQKEMQDFLKYYQGVDLSIRQIKYVMKKLNISRTSSSTNEEVRQSILEELNNGGRNAGYRTVWRSLRRKGCKVTRSRVQHFLNELDPQGVAGRSHRRFKRGVYVSKGPNQTWHMDGHDKLAPYGICITGCIDGYSRKIIWLEASSTNHDPKVIAHHYLDAVENVKGCPLTVRADHGTENVDVGAMQTYLRRHTNEKVSFIYGKSMGNQRIEQFWSVLLRNWGEGWRQFLSRLGDEFEHGSHFDKCLVRFVFLPFIRKELGDVVVGHNTHRIRYQAQLRVPCGIPNVLYHLPQTYGGVDQLQVVDLNEIVSLRRETTEASVVGDPALQMYFEYVMRHKEIEPPSTRDEAVYLYTLIKECAQNH